MESMKLIDLLDVTFEKPDVGTVNLKHLYTLIRSLIVGLKVEDLVVEGDLVVDGDPLQSSDGGDRGNSNSGEFSNADVSNSDVSEAGDSSGSPSSEIKSITLDTGNESPSSRSTATESSDASMNSKLSELQDRYAEILNQLNAHTIRLTALERDVDTLKSKRTETLEMLSKILDNIDQLESRLCEQQKHLAKLTADLNCLSLIVGQYESNFEDIYRIMDGMGVEIRTIKCNIRCMEKEREKFFQAVQTVTEQINHFSLTKADKADVERELELRALVTDLERYVPFECFNPIQAEVARSIALLHEADYNQQTAVRAHLYELNNLVKTKAGLGDLDAIRKLIQKVSQNLKSLEQRLQSKSKQFSQSAGIVSKNIGPSNCLACGDHATLETCYYPIPLSRPFIPMGKTKDIFTIRKRNVGGSHTKTTVEERLIRSAPVQILQIPSRGPSECHHDGPMKQIAGDDGCCYMADQETEV
ncbi:AAEL017326-PA [Aedes aegypti]|uniref:AAEL017326-PA n=1 Tax=Aedes aegypti TaxID=7159 RepID=J9HTW1_AEDAE|nr:AAEL017326-PA [Aedes aegypti]